MNQNHNSAPKAAKITHPATAQAEYARLVWRSRRGMLELDLVFSHFLQKAYLQLDADLQLAFQSLIESEDPYLYDAVILGKHCRTEHLAIIRYMRDFVRQTPHNTNNYLHQPDGANTDADK